MLESSRVYKKACQLITPIVLKNTSSKILHRKAIKYAKEWHPYVDELVEKQIKIFELQKDYLKIQLTATGVLQFYTEEKVYLIPCGELSRESLEQNFINWSLIKDSDYKDLVEYQLELVNIEDIVYYEMSRLNPLSDLKEAYEHIIGRLKQQEEKNFFEYLKIDSAVDKLKMHCKMNFEKIVEKVQKVQSFTSIGPIHGDLTAQNILQTDSKNVVMIDLDRFTFKGIQYIDTIHFYVESMVKEKKTNWLALLPALLRGKYTKKWTEAEIVGYFLYRIDAEIRDNIEPSKSYKKQVLLCSQQFSDYFKIDIGTF